LLNSALSGGTNQARHGRDAPNSPRGTQGDV
jgi:hypothetical protein